MSDKNTLPPVIIFWFRRDLRLFDNHGLYQATKAAKQRGCKVLPLFIFDRAILDSLPKDDARVSFIHQCLSQINAELQILGSGLLVKYGNLPHVYDSLLKSYNVQGVYCNRDYEPAASARDQQVKDSLNHQGIAFYQYKDQVIFERGEVLKNDGKPYTVFTPYKKRWLANFNPERDTPTFAPDLSLFIHHQIDFPDLSDIGFLPSHIKVLDYDISCLKNYQNSRDFPALDRGTSKLSVHLRFGTVSIREWVEMAYYENETFLSELIWREFFMQILWHFPHVVQASFRPQYDAIRWRNNQTEFAAWCQGKTGYPLVDAGMRELAQTGYMHNRVRMVAAGFLCKHLLIDWRWGQRYFAEKLLDFELSSNNGNWQWAAGCGCDTAPYFRIFNPQTQFKRFDKNGDYVRRFVPEFDDLSYPQPIVEHRFARQRCLDTYKAIKSPDG